MAQSIHGETFDLNDEKKVTEALRDGALVILSATVVNVPINSANLMEAWVKQGNLGYTTDEFVQKQWFLSPVSPSLLQHETY